MTEEQAQHVYEAVQSGKHVQPFASYVNFDQFVIDNDEVNPYHKGLCAMVDTKLFQEPRLEMDQCDLNWSILSTHVDYTTHRDLDSPCKDMNTSVLYDRLGDDDNLVSGLHGPCSSSLGLDHACFVGCCFSCGCCSTNALGNAVRVYPETVQGLTFYHSKDN